MRMIKLTFARYTERTCRPAVSHTVMTCFLIRGATALCNVAQLTPPLEHNKSNRYHSEIWVPMRVDLSSRGYVDCARVIVTRTKTVKRASYAALKMASRRPPEKYPRFQSIATDAGDHQGLDTPTVLWDPKIRKPHVIAGKK